MERKNETGISLNAEQVLLPFAWYRFEKDQRCMELKDFQQGVLDKLNRYLDELVEQYGNYVKVANLKKENPDIDEPDEKEFIETADVSIRPISETFDPVYAVRSVSDIIPNPWLARQVVAEVVKLLASQGLDNDALGVREAHIIEELRKFLLDERDKLAEIFFKSEVEEGRIQFRLRTDGRNWQMPEFIETDRVAESRQIYRPDGKVTEKSLFPPVYQDDFNAYEEKVACYLDGQQAITWWHRNIAKRHYSLQGWRKQKIYPDFIFAMTSDGDKQRLMIVETKGDHLKNEDSDYKQKLLNLCTSVFSFCCGRYFTKRKPAPI